MEALSQLDVHNPDHISVITRDGKITVSVTKDGASVTLGFPIRSSFDTTPRFPLQQQPAPQVTAVKNQGLPSIPVRKPKVSPPGNRKLTDQQVRTIKLTLKDKKEMDSFNSRQEAYEWIAEAYKVSHHTISNIDKGLSWRGVKI